MAETSDQHRPFHWPWLIALALVSSHILIAAALLGLGLMVMQTQRGLHGRELDHIRMEAQVGALTKQVGYARRDIRAIKKSLKVNGNGEQPNEEPQPQ